MRTVWFAVLCEVLCLALSYLSGCDSPIASRVRETVEVHTTWTPEAIEKDPEGYLRYVMNDCDRTESRIEQSRITYRKEKSKLQAELASAKSNLGRYQRQLEEYKQAYKVAEESSRWPAAVDGGLKLSKNDLRTVIVEKNRQVGRTNEQIEKNPELIRRLDNRLGDLDVKANQVSQAKTKAKKKLDDVRTGQVFESVEEIEIKLYELDAAADSLGDVKPEVTLKDVETPVDTNQAEFDAIMND